jgi:hypothetical protein
MLFFAAPMSAIVVYCAYGLLLSGDNTYPSLSELATVLALGAWLLIAAAFLVWQEWYLLWGKDFYA